MTESPPKPTLDSTDRGRRLDVAVVGPSAVRRHGQGRVTLEVARALADRGHRVTVYAHKLDADLAAIVSFVRIGEAPGPQIVDDLLLMVRATLRLRRARHDAVCIVGTSALPIGATVLNIQFSHRGWRETWTPQTRPALGNRLHARAAGLLESICARRATRIIASTGQLGSEVAPRRQADTVVVPNGIDLVEFHPATSSERSVARKRLGLATNDFVVSFFGEYQTTRKGLEPLLQAVALGAEKLVVAAQGDDEQLNRRVRDLGVEHRVLIVGFEPPASILAASDLVAVPSLYEPWSLVGMEAAASGVPVIIARGAGVTPYLGDAALPVADPADPAQLRTAIDALQRAPTQLANMQGAGPKAAESLTWRQVSARAAEVVEEVAERPRRRILFVDHETRLSGGERDLVDLVRALDPRDAEIHVALPGEGPLAESLRQHGAHVHLFRMNHSARLSRWQLGRRPISALRATPDLGRAVGDLIGLCRTLRPDVVHTNSMKAHFIAAPGAIAVRAVRIWHVRDILERGWLRRVTAASAALLANRVIVLSAAAAEQFVGSAIEPRVRVVYNGVRPEEPNSADVRDWRQRMGAGPADHLVGMVGQLAHWKGQDTFVEAAGMLARRHPAARFAIVGECLFPHNEASFVTATRLRASDLGLDERLVWVGPVEAVQPVMSAIDVLVHASRLPEPFGRVIVEAMWAGTPVVASTLGAAPELVAPDASRLVGPDNPQDLAGAIAEVLEDLECGPRREALAAAARTRAARFDIAATADGVLGVYRELGV